MEENILKTENIEGKNEAKREKYFQERKIRKGLNKNMRQSILNNENLESKN